MALSLNELLKIQFETATVLQDSLREEVNNTLLKAYNVVQNFLESKCLSQSVPDSNSSSPVNNCENLKSETPSSEKCPRISADSSHSMKSILCLPSYLNVETIGAWCTSCFKDALCVAVFPQLVGSSHQTYSSSSPEGMEKGAEDPLLHNYCEIVGNVSTVGSKTVAFANSIDDLSISPSLCTNDKEDCLQPCKSLTLGCQSLDCSSSPKGLPTNNKKNLAALLSQPCQQFSEQCNSAMTSALVSANALMDFCWQQLNTGNWKDVAIHWRQLYTWSCVAQVSLLLQCLTHDLHVRGDLKLAEVAASVQRVVRIADLGLLMGAPLDASPLASCASILNPLARLSVSAEERGVLPKTRNLNQCGRAPELQEHGECSLKINQEIGVKGMNLNRSVQTCRPSEGKVFLVPQCTDSSQVNLMKQGNNEIVPGDLNFPFQLAKKVKTEAKEILDSHANQTQGCLVSKSSQSISQGVNKGNINSTKHALQSTNAASSSPTHPDFKGLLKHELCARHLPPVTEFYMNHFLKQEPVKLLGVLNAWPAMKKWSPDYLRQLAGARTVPIEVGARYTDSDWSQELITLDKYVTLYMTPKSGGPPGYLAQHQLLDQISELLDDIMVPDYCHLGQSEPRLNAWIGPKGTVSPLHHDPDHNILAQVVGYKYVRLYAAAETARLYPHEDALLSNTSRVDVEGDTSLFPEFAAAVFTDLILGPGDCVYIPPKCWHYVRSLSVSISVSFWWS